MTAKDILKEVRTALDHIADNELDSAVFVLEELCSQLEDATPPRRQSWKKLKESEPGVPDTIEEMRGER